MPAGLCETLMSSSPEKPIKKMIELVSFGKGDLNLRLYWMRCVIGVSSSKFFITD